MRPEEPFDVTRANEYQGPLNRMRVGGNIGTGVIMILCGVGFGVIAFAFDAPWWLWAVAAFFVLLGSLATAYWHRAFRRSRPPHDQPS